MELKEYLKQDVNFPFLSEEALEILGACFEIRLEEIPAGEIRKAGECIGYLLRGQGMRAQDTAVAKVQTGSLIGIAPGGGSRGHHPVSAVLTAETDCAVLWIPYDVLEFACHRSCWFHTRLMLAVEELLEKEKDAV